MKTNKIETNALVKALDILVHERRQLNLNEDKDQFTTKEMKALIKMNKDKTMKAKFKQVGRDFNYI